MKTIISAHRKWLALALFVLAAGFCYSCRAESGQEAVFLTAEPSADEYAGVMPDGGTVPVSEREEDFPAAVPEKKSVPEQDEHQGGENRGLCYVHVCGEVVCPGVYRLTEGQRVFEAVDMAGGFTDAAADAFLNLAEPVFDGMKVEVPDEEQAARMEAGQEKPENGFGDGKINLNTATREELMTLRGIGQAKADDILAYRQQHGGFGRIEEIMEVPGIKEAAFQKIQDDITV